MTDPDAEPQALIEGLRADYNPDGTLHHDRGIEVRVNYSEVSELRFDPDEIETEWEREELAEKYDEGELIDTEYLNGAYARLRFNVNEEGTASLSEFKDASPSDGNWIDVQFLRVVDSAERAVATVPGVEDVVPTFDVLSEHINDGTEAEVRRA